MRVIPAESAGRSGPRPTRGVEDASPPWQHPGQVVTGPDVRTALARLSAEHRQVIVEIYYHQRSVAETADLLCIRASQVVSLASSAVRQLLPALTASPGPSPRRSTDLLPTAHRPGRADLGPGLRYGTTGPKPRPCKVQRSRLSRTARQPAERSAAWRMISVRERAPSLARI